jgi:hypothetical protein
VIFKHVAFVIVYVILVQSVFAQNSTEDLIDGKGSIDSIFDGEIEDSEQDSDKKSSDLLQDFIQSKGFSIDTSYSVMGGILPGWKDAPWYFTDNNDWLDKEATIVGAKMSANIALDIRPSRFLRVSQSVSFAIPSPPLTIKEFYFDYNFRDSVYVKAGKYDESWGYSPNYPYANLLARIPKDMENPGDPYVAKIDVPIGIGGAQFIMLTRNGFIEQLSKPKIEDFGGGVKYNIAHSKFDIDLGMFYLQKMPFRLFYSVKTNAFDNTEFYSEGMMSVITFSTSVGVVQSFFKDRLWINAEIYLNGEGDADSLRRNNLLDDEKETFPLLNGLNTALNIRFKPGWLGNFQMFISCLYSFYTNSAQLVPGIALEPATHLQLYFAVPMAPGNKGAGTYYHRNADWDNRPFSFILAIKINGSYKYKHLE